MNQLDEGRQGPLTVVSAPAGYGKSTSVAAWLGSRNEPFAWLSLDPGDSELGTFASYLVAAVRTVFPEACPKTRTLLEATELPTVSVLARSLANELKAVGAPFVLVLDDYQTLEGRVAHELLCALLAHPPHNLHLIVVTRRDPPLPMASLRARGELGEVRLEDLQFSRSESERFLKQSTGLPLSEGSLAHVHDLLEGWPVGLRLVSLALRTQENPEAFLCSLKGATHELEEYLVQEVLAGLSSVEQHWLIRSSVLERFCAPSCEAVCAEVAAASEPAFDGTSFVSSIRANGLFAIGLDDRNEWYRFHHTFRRLLRDRLERQCGRDEIRTLHSRAARWFDEHALPDEALHHALAAADYRRATEVVRRHRNELVNTEQWPRLARWLAGLPESIAEQDPALLVAQALSDEYRFRSCSEAYLQKAEERLLASSLAGSEREALQGEIDVLRAFHAYSAGQPEKVLSYAEPAMLALAPEARGLRAYAVIVEALARQSLGERQACLDSLHRAVEAHAGDPASRSLFLTGLSYAYWLEGDLVAMKRSAQQNLRLGEEHALRSSIAYANYLLGILHYVRDELGESAENLEAILNQGFFASQEESCHAAFALALVRLGQGRSADGQQVVDSIGERALETGDARLLELARAFEAEFDLRLGRNARALRWAETSPVEAFSRLHMFYVPSLTLAKVRLADERRGRLQQAMEFLDRLLQSPAAAYNAPVRIQALCLRALAQARSDSEAAALATLTEALELAAGGSFVRPFADLGVPMASLLERLPGTVAGDDQVQRVLASLRARPPRESRPPLASVVLSDGADTLVQALTNREQDVLELLVQRLRDKEIAETLFVSPGTVKSHLKSLYRKLGVGDRRGAVARARELCILAAERPPEARSG